MALWLRGDLEASAKGTKEKGKLWVRRDLLFRWDGKSAEVIETSTRPNRASPINSFSPRIMPFVYVWLKPLERAQCKAKPVLSQFPIRIPKPTPRDYTILPLYPAFALLIKKLYIHQLWPRLGLNSIDSRSLVWFLLSDEVNVPENNQTSRNSFPWAKHRLAGWAHLSLACRVCLWKPFFQRLVCGPKRLRSNASICPNCRALYNESWVVSASQPNCGWTGLSHFSEEPLIRPWKLRVFMQEQSRTVGWAQKTSKDFRALLWGVKILSSSLFSSKHLLLSRVWRVSLSHRWNFNKQLWKT